MKQPTTNLRTAEPSESRLLFHAGSVPVRGCGAFHNGECFHVDVLPRPGCSDGIDTTVHFSVAGIAHGGDNFYPTGQDGTVEALQVVEHGLREIGIETDLRAAYLSRVDLFQNVETSESYRDYQPLFAAMTPQRMSPSDYGTGFRWGNSVQQLCVYSKLDEMALKARKAKKSFNPESYPPNVLRFEWRLYGLAKARTALKMETAGALLDGFQGLHEMHQHTIRRHLFRHSPVDRRRVLTVREAEAGLRYFMEQGERYWFERWWSALLLNLLDSEDLGAVACAAERVAPNRETPRRIREKLRGYKLDAVALRRVAPEKPTIETLYRELEQKLLAA